MTNKAPFTIQSFGQFIVKMFAVSLTLSRQTHGFPSS